MARSSAEGMGVTQSLEGDTIFTAYSRLPGSGWTVAIGIPVGEVNRSAARSIAAVAAAVALSILIGLGMALGLPRRITEPIARLPDLARPLDPAPAPTRPGPT